MTVGELADIAAGMWGDGAAWTTDDGDHPHEAGLLALDASRARENLHWSDALLFPESVQWTIDWERARLAGLDPREITRDQLVEFDRRLAR